jgi:hypothetical protein
VSIFASGYDLLEILWGTGFILVAIGFIYAMNRVFQSEERRSDEEVAALDKLER